MAYKIQNGCPKEMSCICFHFESQETWCERDVTIWAFPRCMQYSHSLSFLSEGQKGPKRVTALYHRPVFKRCICSLCSRNDCCSYHCEQDMSSRAVSTFSLHLKVTTIEIKYIPESLCTQSLLLLPYTCSVRANTCHYY